MCVGSDSTYLTAGITFLFHSSVSRLLFDAPPGMYVQGCLTTTSSKEMEYLFEGAEKYFFPSFYYVVVYTYEESLWCIHSTSYQNQ